MLCQKEKIYKGLQSQKNQEMRGYTKMIKVLFICHGNICRSPMAQYVFEDMVKKQGIADLFEIDSAATSREERSAMGCIMVQGVSWRRWGFHVATTAHAK